MSYSFIKRPSRSRLTMEQYNALKAFRQRVRTVTNTRWKTKVRELWRQGIALDDVESIVYQLRNTHGPGWLKKFNLDTCPVPRS